jgi:hypothetical protein
MVVAGKGFSGFPPGVAAIAMPINRAVRQSALPLAREKSQK